MSAYKTPMKSSTFSLIFSLSHSTRQPDYFTNSHLRTQMPSSFQQPNLAHAAHSAWNSAPPRRLCIWWDAASMAPPPAQGVPVLCPTRYPGPVAPTGALGLSPLLDSCWQEPHFPPVGITHPRPGNVRGSNHTEWRRRPSTRY